MLELKAKLSKAKEVAQAAADTAGQKFYDLGVQEIEAWLSKELAAVCKEYCLEVWTEGLNVAGAPVDSKWRKAESIYYPENLREIPKAAPEEAVPAFTAAEQPPPEAAKKPSKAGDQGRGVKVAKGKETGQRRKVRARKSLSRQWSLSRPSLKLWPKRRRPLILLFLHWSAKKTLPRRRLSLGFFFLFFFLWLGQFAPVYDVLFLLWKEKILLFAFVDLCFSCNVCLWLAVTIVFPFAETFRLRMLPRVNTHTLTKASNNNMLLA